MSIDYGNLRVAPEPMVYEPAASDRPSSSQYITVRAAVPFDVAEAAREIGGSLDPALPVGRVVGLDQVLSDARAESTMLARLMSVLAGFAAALAAVGLYGVVAFTVSARARELGIRIALGAESPQIFRLVLRSVIGMTGAGLVFGLAGAVALARALESRLYGVAAFDVWIWSVAAVGLVLVSLAAALLPARRATRVDPVEALRSI